MVQEVSFGLPRAVTGVCTISCESLAFSTPQHVHQPTGIVTMDSNRRDSSPSFYWNKVTVGLRFWWMTEYI